MTQRLHKLLAQHGVGSRRQVEHWIREGRVLVNGRPAEIGQPVDATDRIVVDGRDVSRLVKTERALRVIAYHKPTGEMLRSREGDDREGVEARLPNLHGGRWVAINALGFGEDGLLMLASDGALASRIARRGHELPVEYRVRALKPRLEDDWPELPLQVELDSGVVIFSAVEPAGSSGNNAWFRVAAPRTVPRGSVRALFDAAGLKVSRVMLVQWGPVKLPRDLPRSRSRDLKGADLDALLLLAGYPVESEGEPTASRRRSRGAGGIRKTVAETHAGAGAAGARTARARTSKAEPSGTTGSRNKSSRTETSGKKTSGSPSSGARKPRGPRSGAGVRRGAPASRNARR